MHLVPVARKIASDKERSVAIAYTDLIGSPYQTQPTFFPKLNVLALTTEILVLKFELGGYPAPAVSTFRFLVRDALDA